MEYLGNISRTAVKCARLAAQHFLKYYQRGVNKLFSLKANRILPKMGIIWEYLGTISRTALKCARPAGQHFLEYYHGAVNKLFSLEPNRIFLKVGIIWEYLGNIRRTAIKSARPAGQHFLKYYHRAVNKLFSLEPSRIFLKIGIIWEYLGNIRRKNLETPTSIAQHLLENYLNALNNYPELNPKYIFKKMLQDRSDISKKMSADEIEKLVNQNDTLVELTLAVIENENKAAMGPSSFKETIRDVLKFFRQNAPLEMEKLEKKAREKEKPKGSSEKGAMPDHRTLEKRIESLIAGLSAEMFNDPNACIVMYKDYAFACSIIQEKDKVLFGEDVLAKMNLREVEPQFENLSIAKTKGDKLRSLKDLIILEMYAGKCLDMLLERM